MKTALKTTAVAALASIMAFTGMIPAQAQVIRPVAPIAATIRTPRTIQSAGERRSGRGG